ncbi:alpha/beta hydrolase fold domain-containing protein [Streptomyces sp. 378]|uniref:alpha/beta hydrolase fold domain-containing protein n=1 Tax=Streptomyces sp. 378 TaxID=3049412 RepID=UPI0024C46036|nr:alpha/beta hydrolase fold domain-containing protein [Streptomyces sp. 378]MDK1343309.1 alpha/beta hydrolase fold domain-containing protein [Streptomyces sp. 378]
MSTAFGHLRYGPSGWQRIDLYGPAEPEDGDVSVAETPQAAPVVLVHGGFWRHDRTAQDLEPLAFALAELGHRVAVLEYRPSWDGGAWPGAAEDCRAALHLLGQKDSTWDGAVLVGHSAGAHLLLAALQEQARGARVVLLAPVTDLAEAARLGVGEGAVEVFLAEHRAAGGTHREATPVLAPADAASVTVVSAQEDQAVPVELTRHQLDHWPQDGPRLTTVSVPGARHMHLVNPQRPACRTVMELIGGGAATARKEDR